LHAGIIQNGRLNAFIFLLVFSVAILWFIRRVTSGEKLYVRPLPGLNAIDEAVGRATEMGRVVLFIPGTGDLDNIQTIAGLSILGRVAHLTARYQTPLRVPVLYPMPMAAAQETVRQAYLDEGQSDRVHPETVQYIAGDSFSYSARIGGMMVREKPAAAIYMGQFAAESLLMAEMGQVAGAIQIAGTAEPEQMPFFIAACDYTLLGEELYAADAYLSGRPSLLGSLRGQDIVKLLIVIVVIAGALSVSLGIGHDFWENILSAK
jgi:hypothetical protein